MKNLNTLYLSAILLLSVLAYQACKQVSQAEQEPVISTPIINESPIAVTPPFEGVEVEFSEHEVDAIEGEVIKISTGTMIKVPKNAFTDQEGNPLDGKVTIKYREYHDMASVLASGITMADKNDPNRVMQSAGMFELQGEQDGKAVLMANDKSIEVAMGSFVPGNDYDFFILDEENCQWVEKGTAEAKPNENKQIALQEIEKQEENAPRRPKKVNKEKFVFNLDVDYSNFPELKAFKNVIWQYAGNSPKTNPEKNNWVFKTDWTAAEIETLNPKKGKYKLLLTGGGKTFETVVTPVLSGKDYESELAKFNEKNVRYQEIKENMVAERQRIDQEADLLRSYNVNGFGIFNWDIWKKNGRILVNADIKFDQEIDTDINQINIFLINEDENILVKYTEKTLDKFSYDPSFTHRIVAILPGNQVAVFQPNDFKELNDLVSSSTWREGEKYTFELKTQADVVITSVDDIQDLLDNLG